MNRLKMLRMAAVIVSVWIIFAIIGIPILAIYCINNLFNTGIEYTLFNWVCMFGLFLIFGGEYKIKSN